MSSSTAITLIIKAPNQKIDDQSIDCDLEWKVNRLKLHIATVYPTKPVSPIFPFGYFCLFMALVSEAYCDKNKYVLNILTQ